MEYSRNIKSFAFPSAITTEKRATIFKLLKDKILSLENVMKVFKGRFIDLHQNEDELKDFLRNNFINTDDLFNVLEKTNLRNGK